MNLLAGLVNVSGAAKFYDNRKSTKQAIRVSVHFKFLSQKREVDIQQLGSVKDPSVISATRATHVVSGILFGLEAFLIIDRPYSVEEESQVASIQDKATACAHFLASMYESMETDISAEIDQLEASNYKFKVHCDIPLPTGTSLSSLDEVNTFLNDQLFMLAKQGSKCVSLIPKKVWLYPIADIDSSAASLAYNINDGLIDQIEEVTAELIQAEVWINDIQKNNKQVFSSILYFQQQQTRLLQLLKHFRSELIQQLSVMIPKVRNGSASIDELSSLLKQVANSPFSANNLTSLLKGIEQETRAVTLCLKSISSIKLVTPDNLESLGYEYDYVLSFEFRLGGSHKMSLGQMDEYLRSKKTMNDPHSKSTPWYKDGSKKSTIQKKAKAFKEFAQTNSQKDDITFTVSVSNDTSSCAMEGAAIILYTDESPVEFDLPSKPTSVKAIRSDKNEVTLSWSKPKLGADNIISYRVCYRPTKNLPAEWISTSTPGVIESLKLNQLNPDWEYNFGVQAECKIGTSAISEVVTLKMRLPQAKTESSPTTTSTTAIPKLELASSFPSVRVSDLESSSHSLIPSEEPMPVLNHPMNSQLMSAPFFSPGAHSFEAENPSSVECPHGMSESEQDEWRIPENPSLTAPLARNITHKSVELKWMTPDATVDCYTIYYNEHTNPDTTLKRIAAIDGQENHYLINGLTHDTQYVFKLNAKLSSGMILEGDESNIVKTPAYLPMKIRSKSKLLTKKTSFQPAIYELSKQQIMKNNEKRVAHYEVGQPTQQGLTKVLMVVGATGAGKTTLINGIANYIYGVQWDDDFRFVLVARESNKSQAHSQTNWITAYTIHQAVNSPVPYSLTIIDTPGFGNTEGIERDKKIVNQIKDFFAVKPPNGIDVLHGIGFVAQASLARLSHSQRYIFDSILSIFGRDVASNIFMMTTFADGQLPPVLEAIKVAKIPHQTYFKFNNSALFVRGKEDLFDAMFWKMGVKSFSDFFNEFGRAEPRSLLLTREVLNEREQLETVLKELQPQIHAGLTKMDELQNVVIALQRNKALIEQNKDFSFSVLVTKQKKVETPPGRYTTNCLTCNYTCHENCNMVDTRNCLAMDGDGECKICPGKCIWSKHVSNPYTFELYQEEETRTSAELKERHDTAKQGESSSEVMIYNIKSELEQFECSVLTMVNSARKSIMRLDEIALKPNPSEVDYIDQLIASEEQQRKPGYLERIKAYGLLKKKAELLHRIKTYDPKSDTRPIFSLFGDGVTNSTAAIQVLKNKKTKKTAK